jgi:cytochrome c biogenesis protein CcmG/thiol:disulfide interchange protein DsbE
MKLLHWRLIPFFLFIVLAVLFWRGLALDPHHLPSVKIGQKLPDFELSSLDNGTFKSSSMQGHIALLNVWASWCMSCADEQVTLMQLASQGVAIFGLNYKDSSENATQWLHEWGNPYRQVGEDIDGKVAINIGVYGAPETFLLDKQGIIQYRHVGALTPQIWKKEFLPRIQKLEAVG